MFDELVVMAGGFILEGEHYSINQRRKLPCQGTLASPLSFHCSLNLLYTQLLSSYSNLAALAEGIWDLDQDNP